MVEVVVGESGLEDVFVEGDVYEDGRNVDVYYGGFCYRYVYIIFVEDFIYSFLVK